MGKRDFCLVWRQESRGWKTTEEGEKEMGGRERVKGRRLGKK